MKHFTVDTVRAVLINAFRARALAQVHAEYVVEGLLYASLRGVDTHGLRLAPVYVAELDAGRSVSRPEIKRTNGDGPVSLIDGDADLGMVAGRVAVFQCMARIWKNCGHSTIAEFSIVNRKHWRVSWAGKQEV